MKPPLLLNLQGVWFKTDVVLFALLFVHVAKLDAGAGHKHTQLPALACAMCVHSRPNLPDERSLSAAVARILILAAR